MNASQLAQRLQQIVEHAYLRAPYVKRAFDAHGLAPRGIRTLADLGKVPILRKDDLAGVQAQSPPFGGLTAVSVDKLARIFMSPGNIYDPQGDSRDPWRFGHAIVQAGFVAGDIVQNTFSYHMTPAGFMCDCALRAAGCVVIPAGVGNTELQVRMAYDLKAVGYTGTPSFLHTLLSKAHEAATPLAIKKALVAGEMFAPSLRTELERDFGVKALQAYGTADLGLIAHETRALDGWHVAPDIIVELLDIESQQPVGPDEPGQVVCTVFDEAYPLIRFATGDLSSYPADAPLLEGRAVTKLNGLSGRVGDAVKVRGMFVRASQIDMVMKRFAQVERWQAVITRDGHQDLLTYRVLLAQGADQATFAQSLAQALQGEVKVRGAVEFVTADALATNAKRLEDRREWK